MRIALPVLFILIISTVIVLVHDSAPAIGDDPDLALPIYSACIADSDCTLVSLPCGAIAAARKDRRTELQHYYDDVKFRIRCAKIEEPQLLRAVCAEKKCTAVPLNSEEN
ncbi:MAG: hypothetical protein Q8K65_06580 [Alphaproteobacteria bacterium]|nr:hypothetical protein [Alphaproteobacteria bacterium]